MIPKHAWPGKKVVGFGVFFILFFLFNILYCLFAKFGGGVQQKDPCRQDLAFSNSRP